MEGARYYKNMDFSKPVATHRFVDNIKSRKSLTEVCLKAMARIHQCEQGTITNPYDLASSSTKDSRTQIQTMYPEHWEFFHCARCGNVVGYIDNSPFIHALECKDDDYNPVF